MRDWFGFKRRREQLRAEVLDAVTTTPETPYGIVRRIEEKRQRMVNVVSVVTTLHDLTDEGTISRRWSSERADRYPEYWRNR